MKKNQIMEQKFSNLVVQEVKPKGLETLDTDKVIEAIRKGVTEKHELQCYAVVLIEPRSIPKTSSGKIQRRLCKENFLTDNLTIIERSIRTMDKEQQKQEQESLILKKILETKESAVRLALLELYLQEYLAEILNVSASEIDPDKLIITLGIDSLRAIELIDTIEEELEIELKVEELLESASITSLAIETNNQLSAKKSLPEATNSEAKKARDEFEI
jgi:acyl carrier protein